MVEEEHKVQNVCRAIACEVAMLLQEWIQWVEDNGSRTKW